MTRQEVSPVGSTIDAYGVIAEERNISGTLTGVDVELEVSNGHLYLLNILTKSQYSIDTTEQALSDLQLADTADLTMFVSDSTDTREPFIFNDTELTPDVLRNKLLGRVVLDDMAASMFQIDTVEE